MPVTVTVTDTHITSITRHSDNVVRTCFPFLVFVIDASYAGVCVCCIDQYVTHQSVMVLCDTVITPASQLTTKSDTDDTDNTGNTIKTDYIPYQSPCTPPLPAPPSPPTPCSPAALHGDGDLYTSTGATKARLCGLHLQPARWRWSRLGDCQYPLRRATCSHCSPCGVSRGAAAAPWCSALPYSRQQTAGEQQAIRQRPLCTCPRSSSPPHWPSELVSRCSVQVGVSQWICHCHVAQVRLVAQMDEQVGYDASGRRQVVLLPIRVAYIVADGLHQLHLDGSAVRAARQQPTCG